MRSTRSPARRSFSEGGFVIVASLTLASLFTFTSAFGQDAPSVLSLDITSYPINPWLVEETSLDLMEPGEFAREFAVESARVRGYQDVFDAVCTERPGCEEPTREEIHACLAFTDQILEAVEALGRAQEYYEVERPQKLHLVVAHSAEGSEPRRGASTDPTPTRASALPPTAPSAPEEETNLLQFRVKFDDIPGSFLITMESLEPELGTLSAFVSRCSGNDEVWNTTLTATEAADRRAVELTARAKHVVGALRRSESVPQAVAALNTAARSLTGTASDLMESSRADHAPLAHLWSARALKDYGASSCAELYDFAIGADNRNVAMTIATTTAATISWYIVLATEGEEAADRHWERLNRLGGGLLSPPRVPSP